MNSLSPLRLAIVGSGAIAKTHAAAIDGLPGIRLTAVCARNAEKAGELAAPFQATVFSTIESLLSWGKLDAILIATASGAHEAAALPALRAGKHVLCEKPLEISTERVARMIAEAKKTGALLAGFFPMRCGAGAKAVREAVSAGRFGRLSLLSARVKWWRDQDYYRNSNWRGTWALDGGGALINQGIHAVDLLQWLGGPVAAVTAHAATLAHPGLEVEDTLAASLRFENGALGTLAVATSCYPGLDLSIEISGDQGTAILVNDRIAHWRFALETAHDDAIRENREAGVLSSGASSPTVSCEAHREQIADFCRAIHGEESTVIDGREAGCAVAIVEAAYRSARSAQSEPVLWR